MQIDIRSNIPQISAWLTDAQKKQLPFATALAMTMTAKEAKLDAVSVMRKVFDRPTPYTLNALQAVPANKRALVASIEFREFGSPPAKRYLNPEVHGGPRSQKSSERKLQRLMAGSSHYVPARDMPLNKFGNLSGAVIQKIISQVGAHGDQSATKSSRSKGKRKASAYFVPRKGGMILERKGDSIKPVLIFTRPPSYTKRFPFQETVQATVARRFDDHFAAAFERAMANSTYKSAKGGKWR